MVLLDQSTGMARADTSKLLALFQKAAPPTERSLDILKRLTERQGVVFPDDPTDDGTDEGDDTGGSPGDEDDSERKRQSCSINGPWNRARSGTANRKMVLEFIGLCVAIPRPTATSPDCSMGATPTWSSPAHPMPPQRDYCRGYAYPGMISCAGSSPPSRPAPILRFSSTLELHTKNRALISTGRMAGMDENPGLAAVRVVCLGSTFGLPGDYNGRLAPGHEFFFISIRMPSIQIKSFRARMPESWTIRHSRGREGIVKPEQDHHKVKNSRSMILFSGHSGNESGYLYISTRPSWPWTSPGKPSNATVKQIRTSMIRSAAPAPPCWPARNRAGPDSQWRFTRHM
jgi:hypothetical protein